VVDDLSRVTVVDATKTGGEEQGVFTGKGKDQGTKKLTNKYPHENHSHRSKIPDGISKTAPRDSPPAQRKEKRPEGKRTTSKRHSKSPNERLPKTTGPERHQKTRSA